MEDLIFLFDGVQDRGLRSRITIENTSAGQSTSNKSRVSKNKFILLLAYKLSVCLHFFYFLLATKYFMKNKLNYKSEYLGPNQKM